MAGTVWIQPPAAREILQEAFIRGFGILLNRPYPVEVFSSHPVSSINVL